MLSLVLPFLLAAQPAPPAPPPAFSSADRDDMSCVAVILSSIGAKTVEEDKAMLGIVYYLGKLKGRNPGTTLATYGGAIAATSSGEIEANRQRCGADLIAMGDEMGHLGDYIGGNGT